MTKIMLGRWGSVGSALLRLLSNVSARLANMRNRVFMDHPARDVNGNVTTGDYRPKQRHLQACPERSTDRKKHNLVELIETVVLYKLPRLSREEIQARLGVHDLRETRVYQEAKEEVLKEEME